MKAAATTRNLRRIVMATALILASAAAVAQDPALPSPRSTPDSAPQRKDRLAADTAKLLKLATELKAAVDKSTKDQLSIAVVKKAGEVEKLARTLREEMKTTPAN
jgi:hypothetical protein